MAKAVQACREGRISVAEVAGLQALRMHLDDALEAVGRNAVEAAVRALRPA